MKQLLLLVALPGALLAQTLEGTWQGTGPLPEGTKIEFEVASIKPSPEGQPGNGGFNVTATELHSRNTSLADIITFAFELHLTQVSGLPGWAKTERYDIAARLPQGGEPSDAQIRTMLKDLLAEPIRPFLPHGEARDICVCD